MIVRFVGSIFSRVCNYVRKNREVVFKKSILSIIIQRTILYIYFLEIISFKCERNCGQVLIFVEITCFKCFTVHFHFIYCLFYYYYSIIILFKLDIFQNDKCRFCNDEKRLVLDWAIWTKQLQWTNKRLNMKNIHTWYRQVRKLCYIINVAVYV